MGRFLRAITIGIILIIPYSFSDGGLLHGQELSSTRGGVSGTISDNTGAVIPGAKVTVAGDADTRTITTDASGQYTVTNLTPGKYNISVEKENFKTSQAKGVEIVINRISTLNLKLAAGAATETVEVNANTMEVDTTSTALGDNLTDTFYQQVPTARNVGSLFYVAPGAVDSNGTGASNPSIGGATGLENSYIADGVSINDSGYGGLGVWSPSYGSLGTGINLSFIQEVQVKTGAFEPKYGKVNGGIVQIVTKSGGTQFHGAAAAYFGPELMSAQYRSQDSFRTSPAIPTSLLHGQVFSQPEYDASLELGGYIPVKSRNDKLFFFGAFNPALNQVNYLAPNTTFSSALFKHGPFATSTTTYNWAGKVTYKLTDATSLEASAFGDPSSSNFAYGAAFSNVNTYPNLNQRNETGFSRWNFGSRSVVARLNSTITPTTQLNISATYKQSHFTESSFANDYSISDRTTGVAQFQGLGEYQNPVNHDYGINFDIQKIVPFFGQHTFSMGWGFDHAIYDATRDYSGPRFTFPSTNAAGTSSGAPANFIGSSTSASFYLSKAPAGCPLSYCPNYVGADGVTRQVYLRQVRGVFSSPQVSSSEGYHAIYGNDNWSVNRYVTLNAGLRWEEEQLNGPNQQYVFTDNWSPRLGINIDPFGTRKSKVFFNWGRYTQSLPTDAAIRELNQELDACSSGSCRWAPPQDASHNLLVNSDGTITPTLNAAHLLNGVKGSGFDTSLVSATPLTPELINSGTKLNYEEEFVIGLEHQLSGFVLSARYTDRRLLRIVEDMQGVSPEGANAGLPDQIYVIGNPSPSSDYFVNEQEIKYDPAKAAPANCVYDYGIQQDSLGNTIGAACGQNPGDYADGSYTPGAAGDNKSDGKPDGFARPVRHYQALEIEANKNFSHNFLLRANYRFAKLYGNYEGLFRNDNQQSDPGISSLFDFTQGVLGLLGAQFTPGYLNTDRRHVANLFGAYTIPDGMFKRLTVGTGLRGQSGTPINKLASHPVYQNTGEIPIGGRGTAGTQPSSLQLDLHTDYTLPVGEKWRFKAAFDAFNVTDSLFTLNTNQNIDTGFQQAVDRTYGTPVRFQRPFYGRGSIRFEF